MGSFMGTVPGKDTRAVPPPPLSLDGIIVTSVAAAILTSGAAQ